MTTVMVLLTFLAFWTPIRADNCEHLGAVVSTGVWEISGSTERICLEVMAPMKALYKNYFHANLVVPNRYNENRFIAQYHHRLEHIGFRRRGEQ